MASWRHNRGIITGKVNDGATQKETCEAFRKGITQHLSEVYQVGLLKSPVSQTTLEYMTQDMCEGSGIRYYPPAKNTARMIA